MDLTEFKKIAKKAAEQPKAPPPGTASVAEIAAAMGMKQRAVQKVLMEHKIRRVATVRAAEGGYACYNLEQVAQALGLVKMKRIGDVETPPEEDADASGPDRAARFDSRGFLLSRGE